VDRDFAAHTRTARRQRQLPRGWTARARTDGPRRVRCCLFLYHCRWPKPAAYPAHAALAPSLPCLPLLPLFTTHCPLPPPRTHTRALLNCTLYLRLWFLRACAAVPHEARTCTPHTPATRCPSRADLPHRQFLHCIFCYIPLPPPHTYNVTERTPATPNRVPLTQAGVVCRRRWAVGTTVSSRILQAG